MCPWRIQNAELTRIGSYRTIVLGEYSKQHDAGKLYQKNITRSVGFTWEGHY